MKVTITIDLTDNEIELLKLIGAQCCRPNGVYSTPVTADMIKKHVASLTSLSNRGVIVHRSKTLEYCSVFGDWSNFVVAPSPLGVELLYQQGYVQNE